MGKSKYKAKKKRPKSSKVSLTNTSSVSHRTEMKKKRGRGNRGSARKSRSRASKHGLRKSRSRGSRKGLRESRSRGSRHGLRDSRSHASRHGLRDSRSRTSRHGLRESRSRGSKHALRESRSRGSRQWLPALSSRSRTRSDDWGARPSSRHAGFGSRADLNKSSSRSRLRVGGSRTHIGNLGESVITIVRQESRWSLSTRGKIAKYGLFTFNLVFLLTGATLMGMGTWLLLDDNAAQAQTALHSDRPNQAYIKMAAYTLIAFGVFIVLVAFFGCCGACSENTSLLTVYVVMLVVVYAGEIAIGVLAALFKGDATKNVQSAAIKNFQDGTYLEGNDFAKAWDFVQTKLQCCGVYNYTDYREIAMRNISLFKITPTNQVVPQSCCKVDSTKKVAVAANVFLCNNESRLEFTSTSTYNYLNPNGCFTSLYAYINKNLAVILGILSSIVFVELMGIILACCICYSVERKAGHETIRRDLRSDNRLIY